MVLIDTGPLVALFDESEPDHDRCKEALKKLKGSLLTTWPVLTESFYLLEGWSPGQRELWNFMLAGGLTVCEVPQTEYNRMADLMEKYADLPMDLADATLVVLGEIRKTNRIFTLDRRDFSIYRPRHCKRFQIVPP